MSLNKVLLIGNVGREPEIHYVKDGVCTASLSLATSTPGYTLSSGTQVPERTEWHRVLLWRRMAEIAEKYVHKGDKLYIEGELRTRNYTDKKGVTRYVTEIWAEKLELLTPKSFQQTATTMPSDATDTDTTQPPF
ncbi:single-stranded DNA-binding protein [Alloprevotella tannerae]|jgi:single-strand binding protein|uniref:single-stranded DNA-binding protein n=1 Tax=Alloprevotella tannerae TaxID=76122 RepID=UPI0028E54A7F|nr:single-stranded DNA-binding protein [Alloprevotella tannerae]